MRGKIIYFHNLIIFKFSTDVDSSPNRKTLKSGVERMLEFGRELFQMSQRLQTTNGTDESNQKMLEVSIFCFMNQKVILCWQEFQTFYFGCEREK